MNQNFSKQENLVLSAALQYMAVGWCPLPLGERSKTPLGTDGNLSSELRQEMALPPDFQTWNWKTDKINGKEDAELYFHEKINIGVELGEASGGLVDLDFDNLQAAIIGNRIFATLPSFGRASCSTGHRIVKCSNPGKTTKFALSSRF